MNDVPLIQKADINSINTSLIAIKKQLKQLNEAVGLIDIPDAPDLSPYVKKSDIVDVIEADNMNPVTSNAVATSNAMPVNEVTSGNMHSVSSNGVYEKINSQIAFNNRFISWYSANSYSSGYVLLATCSLEGGGNHDIGFCGTAFIDKADTGVTVEYFSAYVRSQGSTYKKSQFTLLHRGGIKNNYLNATYQVSGNTLILRLYGSISPWLRITVKFDNLTRGDVSPTTNSENVSFPLTVSSSVTGTTIIGSWV